MVKLIRISTVPISLNFLLRGQLKYLNRYFNVIAVSGKDVNLEEVKQREGVEINGISMERKISPVNDLISLIKLYFYFLKIKPQIVHSITPKAGLLSMIAAKLAGVPIRMHTFTGLIFPSQRGIMKTILIQMDKLLCTCATNIYPEGEGVKSDLLSAKITNKPLKIIANGNVNGVDTSFFNSSEISQEEKFKLKKKWGIQEEDFVFIFVGRLVRDKGINELVSAFKQLVNPNLKLLLVGPMEVELDPLDKETVEEIATNCKIISVGFQKDVRPYFAISNVLAFPSYREGFPNVVLQAGAMSVPAIVTNISGCNEIIIDGVNGNIIPTQSVEALINSMRKISEDAALYSFLRSNCRKIISDKYQNEMVWNAQREEYELLLAEKGINYV